MPNQTTPGTPATRPHGDPLKDVDAPVPDLGHEGATEDEVDPITPPWARLPENNPQEPPGVPEAPKGDEPPAEPPQADPVPDPRRTKIASH